MELVTVCHHFIGRERLFVVCQSRPRVFVGVNEPVLARGRRGTFRVDAFPSHPFAVQKIGARCYASDWGD